MSELIRFGVSISESLLEAFDRLIVKKATITAQKRSGI